LAVPLNGECKIFKGISLKLVNQELASKKFMIYNTHEYSNIMKFILRTDECIVLDPKIFFIHPKILIFFFRNLFKVKWEKINLKFFFLTYHLSVIQFLKPQKIITFEDNSAYFSWFSDKYKKSTFYAIQNGYRSPHELKNIAKLSIKNYLCFGENSVKQLREYGHVVEKSYYIGSFRSLLFTENFNYDNKNIFDICLISQHSEKQISEWTSLWENLTIVDTYLNKFLKKNPNLKFCIVCRYKAGTSGGIFEESYFKKTYGNLVKIIPNETNSAYKTILNSKIVISTFSTCGIEAVALNKRVLFCDFSKDCEFTNFKNGIWILKERSYESFSSRLELLNSMNDDDYSNSTESYFNEIINSKSSTELIRQIVN